MRERLSFLACAMVILAGCGDDDGGGTDAGMVGSDAGAMPALTGNWECLGTRTAPTPGSEVSFGAHVYDFQGGESSNVANIGMQVFPDNAITADCTGTCQDFTTDATGNVTGIMAPEGGWFAYRVEAGTGSGGTTPVLTVGYNRVAPAASGTVQLPSVSSMTIGFIPSLYRRMRLTGTAIISGSLTDCAGDEVSNAVLRVFRGDTQIQPGPAQTDFFVGYFNGSGLPSATRQYTNTDGIYAAANVEASAEPVRIELWGALEEGGELQRVACEEFQVFADAVSIVSVGPLRSDYAAGSGCAE